MSIVTFKKRFISLFSNLFDFLKAIFHKVFVFLLLSSIMLIVVPSPQNSQFIFKSFLFYFTIPDFFIDIINPFKHVFSIFHNFYSSYFSIISTDIHTKQSLETKQHFFPVHITGQILSRSICFHFSQLMYSS